jgi:hypothetical protein
MVSMISFHNAMQGKSMQVVHSDQCMLIFKRDKQGLVAINKCGEERSYTIDTNSFEFNWYVPYQDKLSSHSETIGSRYHTLAVPARTARMLALNTPPLANAGNDITIEATGNPDTEVVLSGSASSDAEGDSLSFSWSGSFGSASGESPVVYLPLGSHEITLKVSDGTEVSTDTVRITVQDTTPPELTVPEDVAVFASAVQAPVAIGTATATDLFGSVVVSSDAPVVLSPGTTVVTWTATDANGNTATGSQNVTVSYDFDGFYQPVDNLPVINTAKAGKVIPIKWRIPTPDGSYIRDMSAVTSLKTSFIDCDSEQNSNEDAIEAEGSGKAGLHYDLTAEQYVFNWKTSKDMRGKCVGFSLVLSDGSIHNAKFKFK